MFQAQLSGDVAFKYPVYSYYTARAWYSPTLSYLQVSNTQDVPAKVSTSKFLFQKLPGDLRRTNDPTIVRGNQRSKGNMISSFNLSFTYFGFCDVSRDTALYAIEVAKIDPILQSK